MSRKLKALILKIVYRVIRPFVAPRAIIENPYVVGKFLPLQGVADHYITFQDDESSNPGSSDDFPVPPKDLWQGYGNSPKDYLESGRDNMATMLEILGKAGASPETLTRVLDLGCAAGRMLRFYPRNDDNSEIWGVDLDAKCISWCQQHLSPPFMFATTTTTPHLPFEDNYFDLIFCGSLFTHISDLADVWFLELRRILRKGGYAYITIHDKNTVDLLLTKYTDTFLSDMVRKFDQNTSVLSKKYTAFSIQSDPYSQVFYDADYLINKWSRLAKIISVTKEAYGYQTALLFRKP
jgi:ubiquinone/menaquinone biosynthesis C-methylase UbiE